MKEEEYIVTNLVDFDMLMAKKIRTGELLNFSIKELSEKISELSDEKDEKEDLLNVSEKDWDIAEKRFNAIKNIINVNNRTALMVKGVAKELGVHYTTIYRWLNAYSETGLISALLPGSLRCGAKGKSKLSEEKVKILDSVIEELYLTKQRISVQKAYYELVRRCNNAGVETPHINTLRNRIKAISKQHLITKRFGAKTAKKLYSTTKSKYNHAQYPLSIVQIDHTKLDIILVDEEDRQPIGRPWITLAIDLYSRMVTGYYISLDPPGYISVGQCLTCSILPKDKLLAKFNIDQIWPINGFMNKIHVDNAKEFKGTMIRRACAEYNINIQWRPIGKPEYGGHIERLLGTLAKEIHNLPGTTFSNINEKGEYNSEASASFTLKEFEKWLLTYITEIYHHKYHMGIDTTPLRKYEEAIFGLNGKVGIGVINSLVDEEKLKLDFLPYQERTIQQKGVVIDKIHYYSDVLRPYVNDKKKYIFRRDPRDVSVIYFYDPNLRTYHQIPYRDITKPPMSIWELRETIRSLKDNSIDVNEEQIFSSYSRLREQEKQVIKKTKKARLEKQRRRDHADILVKPDADDKDIGNFNIDDMDIKPFEEIEEL